MSADPSDEQDYRDSHTGEGKGEQYDRHYALDAWQAFMWQREQRVIDELLQRHLGGREIDLLDFACGSGRITSFLESRVTRCTGIDLSDSMLDVARGKLERTQLIKADLTRENALGERKFDLITAFRFFTNAQPELRTAVIDRLAQHLAPDGFLLFNNHHIPAAMYFRAQNLLASIRGRSRQPSFRMMTLPETLDLVKSAGLELVELRHVGFLHLPRINFPGPLLNAVDQIAERVGWAARRCESVMVLCRR